ncbi:hypothetical protein HY090_01425 [Candidatus Kaiserbacteria bacterium]|nr:hypothetical protein [Candidatus Kaiserbacteria bacterium]
MEIIPAILPASLEELRTKLGIVRGIAKTVQIDLCDGFFVPARTWPFNKGDREQFERIAKGIEGFPLWQDFDFEIDFMLHNPEKMLGEWAQVGISRAVIHIESKHDFAACRRAAGDLVELGVALNNDTPLSRLDEYFGRIDYVQLMGIATIGKQGEPFDERVLLRIKELKKAHSNVTIQIDGSVNGDSAPRLVAAGADRLVSGSYILRSHNPRETVRELESLFT